MLYLIKVCHDVFTYYKVGTTTDIDKRFSQYQSYIPECELVKTRNGDVFEENIIKRYLHTFPTGYWEYYKNEWYRCAPGDTTIEFFFSVDLEEMKRVIWENRKKVLSSYCQLDVELWDVLNGGAPVTRTIQDSNGNLILNPDWDFDKNFYARVTATNINLAGIGAMDFEVIDLIKKLESVPHYDVKFRLYCEAREKFKSDSCKTSDLVSYYTGTDLENLYSYFGIDGCKAVGFRMIDLKRKISDQLLLDPLKTEIYNTFKVKEKYPLKYIKETLRSIYQKLGIFKSPKASDLEEFFQVERIKMISKIDKKSYNGYRLLSIK